MWRVNLKALLQLREELKHLSILEKITQVDVTNYQNIAQTILEPVLHTSRQNVNFGEDISYMLHLCALAVKFLCLGLLSYSQAHVGAIHLFFLDTSQRSVLLRGTIEKHIKIMVTLKLLHALWICQMLECLIVALSLRFRNTAYKDIATIQRIAGVRNEERPRNFFFAPDFLVVVGLPAEVPVTTVPPPTVPVPPVFAALFCDVVITSTVSIDRAVTVHSCPIAV